MVREERGFDFDDIHRVVVDDELDIDQADNAQVLGQVAGVLEDGLLVYLINVQGRIDGDGVAGVDAGTFHVFHDAGDQHIFPIEHAVHFHLSTHQVLVHQNGMLLNGHVDDLHEVNNVLILIGDLHALAAQDVGGTHQDGVPNCVGSSQRLLGGEHGSAFRSGDLALV